MRTLGRVVATALEDSRRAEALLRDARARRALREDPERIRRMFELRAGEIEELSGRLLSPARPRRDDSRGIQAVRRARA